MQIASQRIIVDDPYLKVKIKPLRRGLVNGSQSDRRIYLRSTILLFREPLELLLWVYLCKSRIRSYLPAATYPPGFGLCELGRLWLTVKNEWKRHICEDYCCCH